MGGEVDGAVGQRRSGQGDQGSFSELQGGGGGGQHGPAESGCDALLGGLDAAETSAAGRLPGGEQAAGRVVASD